MKICKSQNPRLSPTVPDIMKTRILTKTLTSSIKTSLPKDQVTTTITTVKVKMTLSPLTLMGMMRKILNKQPNLHKSQPKNQLKCQHKSPLKNLPKLPPQPKRLPKNQLRHLSIQRIPSLSLLLRLLKKKPDPVASQATISKGTKIFTKKNFNWTGLTNKTLISRVNSTRNLTMRIPSTKDSIKCSTGCALKYTAMLIWTSHYSSYSPLLLKPRSNSYISVL